jgi:hypothetical protein
VRLRIDHTTTPDTCAAGEFDVPVLLLRPALAETRTALCALTGSERRRPGRKLLPFVGQEGSPGLRGNGQLAECRLLGIPDQ